MSPAIGLHPLDVQVLLNVFDGLVAKGATVVVSSTTSTLSVTPIM